MEVKQGYKQTEVGVIPEEWGVMPLKRISPKQSVGLVINPSTYFDKAGTVPLLVGSHVAENRIDVATANRITVASNEMLSASRLETGDLVTVRVGEPGVTAVVPPELDGCNCASMMIVRRHSSFDSHWLCAVMNSQLGRRQVEHVQYGTAQKQFNISDAIDFQFAVPPLLEQRAIATALNDVDALLDGLDRLIAKKRDLKQAAMQQLLTGQTRLPGFCGKWEVSEFGDIATIRNVKVVSSSTPPGTQCVELESLGQGSGRLLGSVDATGTSSKYSFKKGDVLFGRLRAYLRKYWLASFDGVCSTEIWPLIPRNESLCAEFLHLVVQTNGFVDAAGVAYGTHMPRSDWSVLRKFAVHLPPVTEQMAISTVISDMDAELSVLEARRDKTRVLKQAMMQELLTGKTRLVPPSFNVVTPAAQ